MKFDKLKKYLASLVSEYNTPGVDCIIYKEHKEIFRYYTGMSDIEKNKAMSGNELYIIFSMTKMLTCTCALQLFEKGKFSMTDPISLYLPEFKCMKVSTKENNDKNSEEIITGNLNVKYVEEKSECFAKKSITIKDLFTMGAGFNYNLNSKCITKALSEGKTTTREIVGALSGVTLEFEPSTRFKYSLCHDILGALIEVLSGKKLSIYMKENLFDVLGLKDSFFGIPKEPECLSRMSGRYMYDESKNVKQLPLECVFNFTDEYESGGAGLISSAEDYAIFLDALANGGVGKNGKRILLEKTVDLMRTNHLNSEQMKDFEQLRKGYGYGLGVRTHVDNKKSKSLSSLGEFGWDGAAGAFSLVDPSKKISLAYFQQIHGWDIGIHSELRNILYSCID